jgi:outer membrane protein OmpA-like peptidoglycan-associated protein
VSLALAVAVPPARADSGALDLHLEAGGAALLRAPQTDYFGLGGSAAAALEYAPLSWLGIEAAYLFAGFTEGDGPFARPDGFLHFVGLGLRFRPVNDDAGFLLHVGDHADWHEGNPWGDLWISAHFGYVRTGDLDRWGFDVGLGYQFSLVDEFSLGPYVRYFHVNQPDDQPLDAADALGLSFGLAGSICLTGCAKHVEPPDTDGDGLNDRIDRCPAEPEDRDGWRDEDGCPDPDNDGDGIADVDDDCPDEPEDFDEYHDEDGCPEENIDTDGDGYLDDQDGCPREPEDFDRWRDEDGCPDPDNDGDGIADVDDDCPNEPEVVNGVDDEDGCPDEALVRVEEDQIVLDDMLHFEFGTAILRRESIPVFEAVARLLESRPEYVEITIHGHADPQGSARFNDWLAQRRAERVRDLLIELGVAPDRLVAVGHGARELLSEGHTIEDNRLNRRVEFVITRRR